MTVNSEAVREGRRRMSVAHLLVAIAVMFVVLPFVDLLPLGNLIESVVFTAVLLAAVGAIGGRRQTLVMAALLAGPVLIARWLSQWWPGLLPMELYPISAIVFLTVVISHLFRFVVRAPVVNAEVLCGAISVYLLIAVAWAFLFTLLVQWQPGAFAFPGFPRGQSSMTGFVAQYFSLQIITTISFGDIVPATNIARMLTLSEGIVGILYMAILISRLVGLYSSGGMVANDDSPGHEI